MVYFSLETIAERMPDNFSPLKFTFRVAKKNNMIELDSNFSPLSTFVTQNLYNQFYILVPAASKVKHTDMIIYENSLCDTIQIFAKIEKIASTDTNSEKLSW